MREHIFLPVTVTAIIPEYITNDLINSIGEGYDMLYSGKNPNILIIMQR